MVGYRNFEEKKLVLSLYLSRHSFSEIWYAVEHFDCAENSVFKIRCRPCASLVASRMGIQSHCTHLLQKGEYMHDVKGFF